MKEIAVITPYNNEDYYQIKKANDNVISQKHENSNFARFNDEFRCHHFIIVDGVDKKKNLDKLKCEKIELLKNHNDNGNTPRSVGTSTVIKRNYDFIMYLDADNWFLPGHVSTLLNLIKDKTCIGCSYRSFYTEDEKIINFTEDSDCLDKTHVDTSCFLIPKFFYNMINIWHLIPKPTTQWSDRIFYNYLRAKNCSLKYSETHSVAFRTLYDTHYKEGNLPLPKNVKNSIQISKKAINYFSEEKNKAEFLKIFGFWWVPDKK